jgi:ATP-dependent phosphofructokinase / diphosphate-dependent phosphofructokinase
VGGNLGILVGGGPAPGINAVIGAATIRARLAGVGVVGIRDGFEWLTQGDVSRAVPLTIDAVSRIHFRGGSFLGISRSHPTSEETLDRALDSLHRLGISHLITIGGDGTVSTAMRLAERAGGALNIVHVPKTIDDDLDLPPHVDTFGYQTARHCGVEIVKNLMVDAKTTSRWYFVVTAGRRAGHLALGIGKAAGATLTLISEEFHAPIRLRTLVDTLAGAIIKRLSEGRRDGVAVIAEGVAFSVLADDLAGLHHAERDPYGELRIAEMNIGDILRTEVLARLKGLGLAVPIAAKTVGYELRCADPIPFDMEYARDLGYCAAKHVLGGGTACMISLEGGRFVPIPFAEMVDPATQRARMRLVDISSARYEIAQRYMIRLRAEDFTDAAMLARLAATAKLPPEVFAREFQPLLAAARGAAAT